MASWLQQYLIEHPELAGLPQVKRHRHSVHFQRPSGIIEAHFSGAPVCYEATPGDWQPIDTTLQDDRTHYYAPGCPARIRKADKLVTLLNSAYSQITTRVGLYRPVTDEFIAVRSLPLGSRSGDSLIATGGIWTHKIQLLEDSLIETLTISERPTSTGAQAGDWLVLETALTGVTFPDGWVTDDFTVDGQWFKPPTATDAAGNSPNTRRYAKTRNGVQYLYTGVPVSFLATATYPVVIDPDFTASTSDGYVYGYSTTYSTARGTSYLSDNGSITLDVGQQKSGSYYSVWRAGVLFDTSAIGANTVFQANLKLKISADNSTTDFDVEIVKQDWSAQVPLGSGNRETFFDNCLSGTLDQVWRNTSGLSTNTYYSSPDLDASWVSKSGTTYYSLRSSRDVSNTAPSANEYVRFYSQNHSTSTNRPILVVSYGTPLSGKWQRSGVSNRF